uniref:Uncharacterized protein n=1 Tax=Ananas comosus var. bracteatus TaxID=296719 RepID=A0A6V7P3C3_ANACO|nr:unnamed protein product [Ananas comosus var. bracteatus]
MAKEGREIASSAAAAVPLLHPPPRRKGSYARCLSHAGDELKSFRTCLRWMCVDHSDTLRSAVSWSLFFFLSAAVPAADHLLLIPASPPPPLRRGGAALPLRRRRPRLPLPLRLRPPPRPPPPPPPRPPPPRQRPRPPRLRWPARPLLPPPRRLRPPLLCRRGRLQGLLVVAVALCSRRAVAGDRQRRRGVRSGAGVVGVPHRHLLPRLRALPPHLPPPDSPHARLRRRLPGGDRRRRRAQHIRIRRQLSVISHRYRGFIVSALLLVTVSQFATLLLTTRPHAQVNIYTAGELAVSFGLFCALQLKQIHNELTFLFLSVVQLCSLGLVMGMLMCLRSAAKITHKTQAITSHAAAWHACATIDPSDAADDPETRARTNCEEGDDSDSYDDDDEEEEERDEDDLDDAKLMPTSYAIASTVSFQKRQALGEHCVSELGLNFASSNNRAGITVFGFVVDRTWLHALFMIEFSLVTWLLGKTIGIS